MAVTKFTTTQVGTTTQYTVTFEVIDAADIDVYVDGVLQLQQNTTSTAAADHPQVVSGEITQGTALINYTVASINGTITFNNAPAVGAFLIIERTTDDTLLETFVSGGTIRAQDLNNAFERVLFIAQEGVGIADEALGPAEDEDNAYDALGNRISNVANATDDDDAVNRGQLGKVITDDLIEGEGIDLTDATGGTNSNKQVTISAELSTSTNPGVVKVNATTPIIANYAADGDLELSIADNTIDLDKIKNADIINRAEQDAGSPLPADTNIFTASAASRRFDTLVQTGTPTGSTWETGKTWYQNDEDKTVYVWDGDSWEAITSGGAFTRLDKVIYVDAVNGDDTNNGHRISTPKRSIGAALDDINGDATYGDGSVILVAPGVYEEAAPLDIQKKDVSIIGAALRSTIVHPTSATETESLFRVNSGTYLQNLTFSGVKASGTRGHASSIDPDATYGLPETQGWNISFYPDAMIYKSPYIQNCTNFSDSEIDNDNFNAHTPAGGAAGDTDSQMTGGGLLVDGSTVHDDSPLRSIVADSYTHVGLDGPGILVTNNGYVQVTSSYAFFNHYHIKCRNGGQANLAASTTDFGRYSLIADGRSTSAVITANVNGLASSGSTTFDIDNVAAGSIWHGSATRPQDNMLVDVGGNTYPVLGATAITGGWRVEISRPNTNDRTQNLGLDGDVADNASVEFFLRSMIASSGHTMEYVGSGTNYGALPENGGVPNDNNQVIELNNGKVWTAITDHNGTFKVGGTFEVNQQTGFVSIPAGALSVSTLLETLNTNNNSIVNNSGDVTIDDQLDMNSHKIVNVTDPTSAQDAATKAYVDALESDLEGGQLDNLYFRQDTGETIESGDTWSSSDASIATTAAIDARIIDLVDDVGGFVPIANETSFPAANPDINDPATGGTIVSIKEISTSRTPSAGTVTIANGSGSNTVTINGCGTTVLAAGFGVLVETTSTLHTYNFHRLTPKATEVTTVAGSISNVNTVAGDISNVNTVASDISNVNTTAGSISNVNTVAGDISNVNTAAGSIANINTVANDLNEATSEIDTVATNIANVNTVGNDITNVNTVATNISSVNDFAARYRVSATEPTTSLDDGDLWFDTANDTLKVYNATASAWQAGVTDTAGFVTTSGATMAGTLNMDSNPITNLPAPTNANDAARKTYVDSTIDSKIDTALTGDIVGGTGITVSDNTPGSGQITIDVTAGSIGSTQLASTTVTAGTYGASQSGVPSFTVDADGRLTAASTDTDPSFSGEVNVNRTGAFGAFSASQSGTTNARLYANGQLELGGTIGSSPNIKLEPNGNVTMHGNLDLQDNDKILVGTSDDLEIYHDGSNSYIKNNTGVLRLHGTEVQIKDEDNNETLAVFNPQGSVDLYYDNSKKLETTSTGIDVTGTVTCDGLTSDGQAIFNRTADYQIILRDDDSTGSAMESALGFRDSANTTYGYLGYVSNTNEILTLNQERNAELRFGTNAIGRCRITADGHFTPVNGNQYDIGSSNEQWRNAYFDGTVTTDNLTVDSTSTFTGDATFNGGPSAVVIGGNSDIRFVNGNWTGDSGTNGKIQMHNSSLYIAGGPSGIIFRENGSDRCKIDGDGHFVPVANNTYDLGTSSLRWRNVYTNDLNLSNEGSTNDVDNTWGSWTIQEGEDDLFLLNRRNGKKYKFNLTEVN